MGQSKRSLVDRVEFVEVIEACDVHGHGRNVLETHSGRPQDFAQIGEGLASFGFDSTGNNIVVCVLSNGAR